MHVILKNAVKILFVPSKFYSSSTWIFPSMFFQYRYVSYEEFLIAMAQFNNVCCILDAKQHLEFPISEYYYVLNENFCYLFQIQITRLMSNSNE